MDFNASPTLLPQLFPLKDRKLRFETLQLHGGTPHKDPATNSEAIPIYQTSSYVYDTEAQEEALFNLSSCVKGNSNIYGQIGNPTVDAFERHVSALEGGTAAVACSSGQAAQFMALTCIANSGDNIVSTCQIYGGTHNQLKYLLTRFGITTKFANGDEARQIEAEIDSETKAIFCEMINKVSREASKNSLGFGSTLAFGIKGGQGAGAIKALKLHSGVPNAGSVHSLAIHPASMTHARWTEENRLAAGISQDLIRLSMGTEHIDDIIEDLDTAIDHAKIEATTVKPEHTVDHLNLKLSIDQTSSYNIGRSGVPTLAIA